MKQHTPTVHVPPVPVLETTFEPVRRVHSGLDARERMAALVAAGFERTPAPLVARALGRAASGTYALAYPVAVSGLRAHELLLAPRPFATLLLRGLLVQVEGRCGAPSRIEVVQLLARAAQLVASVPEDLTRVPDGALQEQRDALREAARSSTAKADEVDAELRRRSEQRRQAERDWAEQGGGV